MAIAILITTVYKQAIKVSEMCPEARRAGIGFCTP